MTEIIFKADKKHRDRYFTATHFSHPAKMGIPLQRWIIENYTKPREVILDPMAGSGTVLIACTMGRHVICVELEEKFCKMQRDNWAKIQVLGPELGCSMGTATILQGDARNLEGLLCDSIITSPPYGELANEKKNTKSNISREERLRRAGHKPKEFMGGIARNASIEDGLRYSHSEENIGNLPYGSIDAVIDLYNGRIDDIIKSNGQILQGMRESTNTKREGEGTSVPLSQEAILQSELPSQPSESLDQEGQGDLDKGENERDQRDIETSRAENQQNQNGAEVSQYLKGKEGDSSQRTSQRSNPQRSSEGPESPELAGRVEEIPRGELANTTQESTTKGQPSVSDMPRADRPSSPSDTLPNKQGQQLDQSIEFMRSVPRQSNRSNLESSSQGSSQTLPTPLVDCVISSPPYEGSIIDGNENFEGLRKIRGNKASQKDKFRAIQFGKETTAYGKVDSIITSPPYETPMKYDGENKRRKILAGEKLGQRDDVYFSKGNIAWQGLEAGYGKSEGNIGNLKGDTYLQAMLQVYQSCHKVLKPSGLLLLVTKNFIRNKQEVKLDLDTIKLCEQAGFTLVERHYRKLTSQSFWRTLYARKYPMAPRLEREDILIFSKSGNVG